MITIINKKGPELPDPSEKYNKQLNLPEGDRIFRRG